ncbi:hypothetical protein ACLB6G_20260 [Zhengella sp. ZM62]|uniref:hypothetical protein n=1 Tax=Zhengella sedimenti TaxID=3390035 RepID=UPI003975EB12
MSLLNLIPGVSTLKLIGVGIVAAGLAFGAGYLKGRSDMRATARAEAIKTTLEQLQERSATDAEIGDMDDADLCRLIGGVFRDGRCE